MVNLKDKFIIQICGYKNTGKTTFVCELVKYLKEKGLTVVVIKHDGHDFDTEHYKEDNFQHFNSGADCSIVFSKNKLLKVERVLLSIEKIIENTDGYDIYIIEGCKKSEFPKIELLRKGISETPVSNPINRIGIYSDFIYNGEEKNIFQDKKEVLKYIYNFYKSRTIKNIL